MLQQNIIRTVRCACAGTRLGPSQVTHRWLSNKAPESGEGHEGAEKLEQPMTEFDSLIQSWSLELDPEVSKSTDKNEVSWPFGASPQSDSDTLQEKTENSDAQDQPKKTLTIDSLLGNMLTATPDAAQEASVWQKPLVLGNKLLHEARKMPVQHFSEEFQRDDFLERKRQSMLHFKQTADTNDVLASIDSLRPSKEHVSAEEIKSLCDELSRRFSLKQLQLYLGSRYPQIKSSKKTKKGCVSQITKTVWGLDASSSQQSQSNFSTRITKAQRMREKTEQIYFSDPSQAFLLFKSPLIQLWKGAGAHIYLPRHSSAALEVRSSKLVISYVRSSWAAFVGKIVSKRVDFSSLRQLYKARGLGLPFSLVQAGSPVYFKRSSGEAEDETFNIEEALSGRQHLTDECCNYDISALKELHILEIERKLLSNITRGSGQNKHLRKFFTESKVFASSGADYWSLPWFLLGPDHGTPDQYYRLKSKTERHSTTQLTPTDTSEYHELERKVDDFKNSQSLFNKLPFMSETIQSEGVGSGEVEESYEEKELNFEPDIQVLKNDLLDTKNTKKYVVPKENWDQPVFTASFGKALFSTSDGDYFFHESLQSLPSFVKKLSIKGGFEYFLRLKFVPDPNASVEDFNVLPPLQVTFNLTLDNYHTDSYKVDVTSMQVHSIENENVVVCPVPGATADLKFMASSFAPILADFNSNVKQWTEDQPGIVEFLENSKIELAVGENLEFCYRRNPHINIRVNGRPVPYVFTEDFFIKSLELEYEGLPATFTIASGGDLKKNQLGLTLVGSDVETLVEKSITLLKKL
ncbi:unnamed protein product [Kuraishia capsulata CBS 1993]|uniref:Uncharacterized protein n=1 Tax=Kuraishia capsulata CBS 1993 TaxID=1382522 RepID=W6MHN9_9ASCO|nr:uncharacterized protein KUCA_T00001260001 [Kuraishia capsulata CBS 1993]CDK25293.1 unnamed protein product [Kuraishia capsulata CBS 1993]